MKHEPEKRCLYCQKVMERPRTKRGALLSRANWAPRKYCSWDCRRLCPIYADKQRLIAKTREYGGWMTGKKATEETKLKISVSSKGHKRRPKGTWAPSTETREKMSAAKKGEKSHLWRGGKTSENALVRSGMAYRDWRKAVFVRDDYTCQMCGSRGCEIQADHILPFALFPESRLDISNGRTLCVPCHKQTPTYLVSGKALRRAVEAAYAITIREV